MEAILEEFAPERLAAAVEESQSLFFQQLGRLPQVDVKLDQFLLDIRGFRSSVFVGELLEQLVKLAGLVEKPRQQLAVVGITL